MVLFQELIGDFYKALFLQVLEVFTLDFVTLSFCLWLSVSMFLLLYACFTSCCCYCTCYYFSCGCCFYCCFVVSVVVAVLLLLLSLL